MSHASRFGRRCSIWRGFSDDSSCSGSVLDFSFKETMRPQSHFFSWQPHYLLVMDGGLCCPVQCICILDVSCVATVMWRCELKVGCAVYTL